MERRPWPSPGRHWLSRRPPHSVVPARPLNQPPGPHPHRVTPTEHADTRSGAAAGPGPPPPPVWDPAPLLCAVSEARERRLPHGGGGGRGGVLRREQDSGGCTGRGPSVNPRGDGPCRRPACRLRRAGARPARAPVEGRRARLRGRRAAGRPPPRDRRGRLLTVWRP